MNLLSLEKRVAYLEKLVRLNNKSRKFNESVGRLPDGSTPRTVGDVLKSWSGEFDVNRVVRKLKLDGVLADAVNRNYPTVNDVAAAVDECWKDTVTDKIGTAKFLGGFEDGVFKGALTLYPISGGDDPHRSVTLKLSWNDEFDDEF